MRSIVILMVGRCEGSPPTENMTEGTREVRAGADSEGGNGVTYTDPARQRWTQARRILRWRLRDAERRREALIALHERHPSERHPSAPQCLAVITPVGGRHGSTHVAMGKSHWSLLNAADAAVEATAPCVISIHDLDESDIDDGLLTLLALDDQGEITTLPPELRGGTTRPSGRA